MRNVELILLYERITKHLPPFPERIVKEFGIIQRYSNLLLKPKEYYDDTVSAGRKTTTPANVSDG